MLLRGLLLAAAVAAIGFPGVAAASHTWLPPEDVARRGSTEFPEIAMDGVGNTYAIWRQARRDGWVIQVARRPVDGPWSTPATLTRPQQLFTIPHIAVDAAGSAVVVWAARAGSRSVVQASVRPPGGSWTRPEVISGNAHAHFPDVAIGANGDAVAVWRNEQGSTSLIRASVRPAGGDWATPEDISDAFGYAAAPQIAVGPSGDAAAVWPRGLGLSGVEVATRPSGGPWDPPVQLAGASHDEEVGVDAAGRATVVWLAGGTIHSSTRSKGGLWAPAEPVGGTSIVDVELAIEPEGNAEIAWWSSFGFENTIDRVHATRRAVNSAWEPPTTLSVGPDALGPSVAVDPAGEAHVVWSEDGLRSASRPSAGLWQPAIRIAGGGPGASVIASATGYSAVAWSAAVGASSCTLVRAAFRWPGDHARPGARAARGCTIRASYRVVGTSGPDQIFTFGRPDRVRGGRGDDLIFLGAGKDRGFGGPGNDRIYGGPGRDILIGEAGADFVDGGTGYDRCRRGRGDTFRHCP